ncbi:PcfB family protein [Enterococcus sp. AZ128]|uniref:PcfB family protein n=1 Tax=unclassified Enterococcus TaxID=2608891 RepID=UPI003F687582
MGKLELEKLGEPLSKSDYLDHYSLLIKYVLQELTFADWKNPQIIELFDMEMIRAETQWFNFVEKEGRSPDYSFLQNEVTNFGIERSAMFNGYTEGLSLDNFVHFHIEQLKLDNLLDVHLFDKKDLKFIESYERNKAKEYFLKRDKYITGYEDFRISKNQTMQQAGYTQLKIDFVNDPTLIPYQKKEVVDLAVNDERVAEFVLNTQKNMFRELIRAIQVPVNKVGKIAYEGSKKAVNQQLTTGKQRYSRLKKQGTLEHVDVSKTELKPLMQEMKKYKIDFSVKENKETGKIHVFFKAKDRDTLNIALENLVAKFDNQKEMEKEPTKESSLDTKEKGLTEKLDQLEEKAEAINAQRAEVAKGAKDKNKGQER